VKKIPIFFRSFFICIKKNITTIK